MKKIIFMMLIMIIITGCGIGNKKQSNVSDAEKFKVEYPNVSNDNPFVYAKPSKIIQLIEKETGIIFFGMKQDLWSQAVAPILEKSIKENEIDKIYYCDPRDIQKNNTAEYKKIALLLNDFLRTDNDGNKIINYPAVFAIKDGVIVGRHDLIHDGKAQVVNLTEEEIKNINDAYNNMIKGIKTAE